MRNIWISICVTVIAVFLITDFDQILQILKYCFVIFSISFCIMGTVVLTVLVNILTSPKPISYPDLSPGLKQFQQMILQNASKMDTLENAGDNKIKSQVDSIIDEIANLTIEHFLLNHLDVDELGKTRIRKVARKEFYSVIDELKDRLARIDHVEFLTKTTIVNLTKHFETQRLFLNSEEENAHFETFKHLKDEDSEKKYLSQLSLVLIKYLFPECYSKVKLLNILADDILTNCLLYPIIDALTDPDFINTSYLQLTKKLNKEKTSKESPGENRQSLWSRINNFSIKDVDEGHEQVATIVGEDLSLENILMLMNLADTASDKETLKQVLKLLRQNIDVIANLRDL